MRKNVCNTTCINKLTKRTKYTILLNTFEIQNILRDLEPMIDKMSHVKIINPNKILEIM